MVIRISSARQIDTLLEDLMAGGAVAREAAVARLIVVGGRAVNRLASLAAMTEAPLAARLAAFRALEGIGDVRALDAALQATADADDRIAAAAINVARTYLAGSQGIVALDRLTAIALDGSRHDEVRMAALRALRELEPATIQPILDALANDPHQQIRDAAGHTDWEPAAASAQEESTEWIAHPQSVPLPDDPETVRRQVSGDEALSLATLHRLVETIRQREAATAGSQRREWMAARATVHVALAKRGSRLGVYDLREALEAASEPLPVEFLAALTMIGDASCLEALAAAYFKTGPPAASHSDWWHRNLLEAFDAIVTREGLTRRHALAKKIEKRWPDLLQVLWPAPTRRPARRSPQ